MLIAAFTAIAGSLPIAAHPPPKAALGEFASVNYAITFIAPARTTYCPLADNWTGSDHGTVIFLERPRVCLGAGYPSSNRGFEPSVPRIEVYYGYDLGNDADRTATAPKCHRVGRLTVLGSSHALCRTPDPHRMVLWSRGTYFAGSAAEVVLTLVTTSRRLDTDLSKFRAFAATVRTCKSFERDAKGKTFSWGVGPRCPKEDWY